jgi:P27 family predicted phage terminase small subunit
MTTVRHPPAPKHLEAVGRHLWLAVMRDYDLRDGHHLSILTSACEAADRECQAREIIAREGLVAETRSGPRPHPAVAIERDSRIAKLRALRELGLDLAAPEPTRPPSRWRGK